MAIDGRVGDPDLYEYFSNIQSLDALLTFNTLTNIVFPDKHMK
ncbi:hypothetical protein FACS1894218_2800 [Bacilli bacterium]|nr:hypothetical protein FACS1894218_2800 [Bacilli bacterium]